MLNFQFDFEESNLYEHINEYNALYHIVIIWLRLE